MNKDTEEMIREKLEQPLDTGCSALLGALEKTNIYCFKYYPGLKLIVVPEMTCKAWSCKPYYDNMPNSLCEEFVDEAYSEPFRALYRSIDEGKPTASLVFRFKDKKTWSRVTLTTTKYGSDNAPEECIAVVEDLSDAMNTEQQIKERNRELSLVMQVFQIAAETTDNIVFLFDTKRQSILVTDNTASDWGVLTEQTGVPYETARSGIVAEASRDEYIRLHEEMMNGALKTGGRVQLRDAGGNTGYYELNFRALLDENGQPTGKAAGVYKNITESVRRSKRQKFIIESLGNTYTSVYYVDLAGGNYERIAEREPSVMGIPEKGAWSEGYGSYLGKFVDEPYREKMTIFLELDSYEERLSGDENISLEYQRTDKGWRKAFMLPAGRDSGGRVTSVIFAVQQIEAEKKKELETQKALKQAYDAAQLASRAKTTFLSNMSHDIRTPLNSIVGMTAIAANNLDSIDKVSYCLKNITASSRHLLGLINEVLDMSKIESGKVDLNEDHFRLSDTLEEIISINSPLIREKEHTLTVNIKNPLHEEVIGDSLRLQQVFNNLLNNAIKYTPDGGRIEITVSEKETNKPNIGWFEVVFRDNGIGIAEEDQQLIFEPFSRAGDNRISSVQGTGLGMPIARNIIRMMNGDITVQSKINEGSTFTVAFALKLRTGEDVPLEKFADLPVLVADDDIQACESTCAMLNSLGMNSEWVTTGEKAVEKTAERHNRNEDYCAVIVDWKMPGMNGIETTREIRRRVGDDIPVIVLTAYDWSDIEQDARAAGVNAFLGKPLFRSRIVELFNGILDPSEENDISEELPNIPKKLQKRDFSGRRVLLAEDNELNSEIAAELISMLGIEIETAENGRICLEKFLDSAPGYYDLIFMDIQMPLMDGYETTAAIRSSYHPDSRTVPIIAMTANAFSTDVRAAFESGMNGHISKPIDIDNIIEVLDGYFSPQK